MRRYLLVIFVGIAAIVGGASAQNGVAVRASIDSLAMYIGDQANVTFEVAQPAGAAVEMPLFPDSLAGGLEIVGRARMDTAVMEDGTMRVRQRYTVTAFDPALVFIPEYPFVHDGDTFYSNSLTLKVVDVPVDTAQQAITDIKGVYAPPFNWSLFFQIALYVILVLLLAVAVYFIVKRYRKKGGTAAVAGAGPVDTRLAHEIAEAELEELRQEKLWQQNRVKEYYTRLTDIIRRYLNRRYGIDALEATSSELLGYFRGLNLPRELSDAEECLKKLLALSDLVKFAKYIPSETEHDLYFGKASKIVELTKERPAEEPAAAEANNGGTVK